ncbi:hypothetical protein C8R44DRAFT_862360 [Mycena epipterygia]|nr:hypothetical protein C8R44DRAFT_862360 [Mycena epipterygia]
MPTRILIVSWGPNEPCTSFLACPHFNLPRHVKMLAGMFCRLRFPRQCVAWTRKFGTNSTADFTYTGGFPPSCRTVNPYQQASNLQSAASRQKFTGCLEMRRYGSGILITLAPPVIFTKTCAGGLPNTNSKIQPPTTGLIGPRRKMGNCQSRRSFEGHNSTKEQKKNLPPL